MPSVIATHARALYLACIFSGIAAVPAAGLVSRGSPLVVDRAKCSEILIAVVAQRAAAIYVIHVSCGCDASLFVFAESVGSEIGRTYLCPVVVVATFGCGSSSPVGFAFVRRAPALTCEGRASLDRAWREALAHQPRHSVEQRHTPFNQVSGVTGEPCCPHLPHWSVWSWE